MKGLSASRHKQLMEALRSLLDEMAIYGCSSEDFHEIAELYQYIRQLYDTYTHHVDEIRKLVSVYTKHQKHVRKRYRSIYTKIENHKKRADRKQVV